jgi:hypothetical protein
VGERAREVMSCGLNVGKDVDLVEAERIGEMADEKVLLLL